MRFIMFLLSFNLSYATSQLCDVDESLSLLETKKSLILKCDCDCTSEENKFFVIPKSLEQPFMTEASRLLSINGLTYDNFLKFKKRNKLCSNQNYLEKYKSSYIFIKKEPTNFANRYCFSITTHEKIQKNKENSYINSKLYILNNKVRTQKYQNLYTDDSFENMGLMELSNRLFIKSTKANNVLLERNTLLKGLEEKQTEHNHTIVTGLVKYKGKTLLVNVNKKFLSSDTSLVISRKCYLHKYPNKKTKMYLIKGDMVTLLDEQTDDKSQKWYFINYKGKKDLNMWVKAEAIDTEAEASHTIVD